MKIYKTKILTLPVQVVNEPFALRSDSIIDIDTQNGEPYIWFLAKEGDKSKIKLYSYMTGEEFSDEVKSKKYIGNYTLTNGIKIHVFA